MEQFSMYKLNCPCCKKETIFSDNDLQFQNQVTLYTYRRRLSVKCSHCNKVIIIDNLCNLKDMEIKEK